MTATVRGRQVRVVAGRSEPGCCGQANTSGDRRSPRLGAVRHSRSGLRERLDQPGTRPTASACQGPKRVEAVCRTDRIHAFIVEAASRVCNPGMGAYGCEQQQQQGDPCVDGTRSLP